MDPLPMKAVRGIVRDQRVVLGTMLVGVGWPSHERSVDEAEVEAVDRGRVDGRLPRGSSQEFRGIRVEEKRRDAGTERSPPLGRCGYLQGIGNPKSGITNALAAWRVCVRSDSAPRESVESVSRNRREAGMERGPQLGRCGYLQEIGNPESGIRNA
jgi:hypothetical protein